MNYSTNSYDEDIVKLKEFVENSIRDESVRSQVEEFVSEIEKPGIVRSMLDSVFTDFFGTPGYARDLCAELLEDKSLEEDEVEIHTLRTTLIGPTSNEFSAQVRDVNLALTEEEEWNSNVFLRLFLRLTDDWREFSWAPLMDDDVHGTQLVVPAPKMFVVNPSAPQELGDVVDMGDILFHESDEKPYFPVHIIREAPHETVLGQYVNFIAIWRENTRMYANKHEVAQKTISECLARGIMTDYLETRSKEVARMMTDAMRVRHELELELRDAKAEGIIGTARVLGADNAAIIKLLMSELHIKSAAAQKLLAQY